MARFDIPRWSAPNAFRFLALNILNFSIFIFLSFIYLVFQLFNTSIYIVFNLFLGCIVIIIMILFQKISKLSLSKNLIISIASKTNFLNLLSSIMHLVYFQHMNITGCLKRRFLAGLWQNLFEFFTFRCCIWLQIQFLSLRWFFDQFCFVSEQFSYSISLKFGSSRHFELFFYFSIHRFCAHIYSNTISAIINQYINRQFRLIKHFLKYT